MHALAAHIGPGLAPAFKCLGVFNEIDTDLFKNDLGVGFDDLQRLFIQNLIKRDVAFDEFRGFNADGSALCAARRAERTAVSVETAKFIERNIPLYEILDEEALQIIETNASSSRIS